MVGRMRRVGVYHQRDGEGDLHLDSEKILELKNEILGGEQGGEKERN